MTNRKANRLSVAKLVKQQLEAVGFKVTINEVKNDRYKYYAEKRIFDIYVGETKIPNDMSLNSFFTKKGATRYGINIEKSKSAGLYKDYLNAKAEIGSFIIAFSDEMPFIPVLYKQGMICYSKSMHGDMQGYTGNYFSNIEDWYYN